MWGKPIVYAFLRVNRHRAKKSKQQQSCGEVVFHSELQIAFTRDSDTLQNRSGEEALRCFFETHGTLVLEFGDLSNLG